MKLIVPERTGKLVDATAFVICLGRQTTWFLSIEHGEYISVFDRNQVEKFASSDPADWSGFRMKDDLTHWADVGDVK